MINVAVVGLGFMGVTHLKAYRQIPGVRLAAICDAFRLPRDGDFSKITGNFDTGDSLRLDMSQVGAYSRLEDVLAQPAIDLVDLCVPTEQHHAMTLAALRAGKHVVCEKPLARSSALAREMVAAAEQAGRFLMPAMCIRFWPEWAWVKRAIAESTYGRVLAARFRRVAEAPAWGRENYFKGDQSGGGLFDIHVHDVDFVQHCFGRPLAVYATGLSRFSGAYDHVVAQYDVACGAVVYAEGSWIMSEGHGFNMAFTVTFERATADYDVARGPEALRLFEAGQKPRTVKCEGADGYAGELAHIVDAIRTGRPPTVVTARDGLGAVEICEAEEQSIRTGQKARL